MSIGTMVLIGLALLLVGVVVIASRSKSGSALGLAVFAIPVLLVTGRL